LNCADLELDLELAIAYHLLLESYTGPVVLIRRTQDEMITTDETGTDSERLASNRANHLLKRLILTRHPKLFEHRGSVSMVDIWLGASAVQRSMMLKDFPRQLSFIDVENLTEEQCATLIYCLCAKYMIDFHSNHNTPLDPMLFIIPVPL
uniref:Calponin-homology (CH) domain-containing protein n=1 Tax=Gongylonema pulchrum TaxID=637853 RepID=A0A183EPR4_9BILA